MTTKELGERVTRNEEAIDNIVKTLDGFSENYSTFKKGIFDRFDQIQDRLMRIETKLETEEKNQLRVVNIRMWFIGIVIGTITFLINFFIRR